MRTLQIIFLLSFAVCALVIPYLVFSRIQGGGDNSGLVIFVAIIFVINAILIVRKFFNLRKEKRQ